MQRDILPIVEGTTVNTKHGMVKTDHILFIAAGAFHVSKPSDLIPELQGRFPDPRRARAADARRLRAHPDRTAQRADGAVHRAARHRGRRGDFTADAIERIADFAARVNDSTENIGARRLHTVMERLLDELSFDAPDSAERAVTIDEAYVDRMLADIVRNEDRSRYIL